MQVTAPIDRLPTPLPDETADPQAGLSPFRWEDLNRWVDDHSVDPELLAHFRGLAARKPGAAQAAFRALGRGMNTLLRIGSYDEFLRCPWNELVELYAEQVVRSQRYDRSPEARTLGGEVPLSGKAFEAVIRTNHQHPCTGATVHRRVEAVRRLCPPDAPVLVLGDDDWLSLALAEAGYGDVTTLDIDAKLIGRLDAEAKRRGVALKARVQDFTGPLAPDMARPYHLAVFDPMCTVEGVKFFTEAALHLSNGSPDTTLFLNTHLMSLLRPGLAELRRFLDGKGLEVAEFHPAFNVYPVSPGTRKMLRILLETLNGTFLRSPALRAGDSVVKWFVSDAMVLRRRPS